MCVSAAADIRGRQLEYSIGGLQGQGYCVERLRLSLYNVEAVEIFFMLMHDDFLLLFPGPSKDYAYLTVFRLSLCNQSQGSASLFFSLLLDTRLPYNE